MCKEAQTCCQRQEARYYFHMFSKTPPKILTFSPTAMSMKMQTEAYQVVKSIATVTAAAKTTEVGAFLE